MIKIEFGFAIAAFLIVSIFLVLGYWIFYTNNDEKQLTGNQGDLEQCPYCASFYYNYQHAKITTCPHCHSYISQDDFLT